MCTAASSPAWSTRRISARRAASAGLRRGGAGSGASAHPRAALRPAQGRGDGAEASGRRRPGRSSRPWRGRANTQAGLSHGGMAILAPDSRRSSSAGVDVGRAAAAGRPAPARTSTPPRRDRRRGRARRGRPAARRSGRPARVAATPRVSRRPSQAGGGDRHGDPIDLALLQAELAGRQVAEGLEGVGDGQHGRRWRAAPARANVARSGLTDAGMADISARAQEPHGQRTGRSDRQHGHDRSADQAPGAAR